MRQYIRDDEGNVLFAIDTLHSSMGSLYEYDNLGQVTEYEQGDVGTTTNFFYSTSGQVLEEQANAAGYYTQRYVWSPTYINSMVDRDTDTSGSGLTPTGSEFSRVWPLQDANYNTVALVVMSDGLATVVERYAYLPFGAVTYMNGSYTVESESSYNWLNLFQGMRQDSTSGNNMSLTRWDNPGTGTWMSEDLSGFNGGDVDLNGFADNNPINEVDPLGLLADPPTMNPNFVGPPTPYDLLPNFVGPPSYLSPLAQLQDEIYAQAAEFVGEIGELTKQDMSSPIFVPGRVKPKLEGSGPCYYFAQRFCLWLQDKLTNDPRYKGIKVTTYIILPNNTRTTNHIITKVVIPQGKSKPPVVMFFDAGTGDKIGAGNMGGPLGSFDSHFLRFNGADLDLKQAYSSTLSDVKI